MGYSPRYTNLVTLLNESTERYADQPLFGTREPTGWRWTTYREFAAQVDKARAMLAKLGVERGDRVAVVSNNRLEWAVCAYATFTRGATYVPTYEAQLDKEWRYILQDSGAKLCFASNDEIAARLEAMREDLPALQRVVRFDTELPELLADPELTPIEPILPDDGDIAYLIYTSGTTGQPKGVMLSHFNVGANASALIEVAPVKGGDRSLGFLPWAHVFGGCVELGVVIGIGGSTGICGDTSKLIEYLPEVQPTMLFAVPRIWNRIYDGVQKQIAARPKPIRLLFEKALEASAKQRRGEALRKRERIALAAAQRLIFSKVVDRFGGQLRFAVSGAAALSHEVAEFIDSLGIKVYEGYGMTECSGSATANTPDYRLGSVGKPIPGVDIKIDQAAPGAQPGEGELVIYGTGVMAGYYNNEEATHAVMTEDGGLRSGDLGRYDEDGFLYITGRVKELFKLQNGKYVAPAPLEERIQLSPYIAQCVVYGADQTHNVALIVPDMPSLREWAEDNDLPTETEALCAHSRTRELLRSEIDEQSKPFKGYERIRDFIIEPNELSTDNDLLTPTLKVKRRNVVQRYGSQLQGLY